jgi:hypothetical protein
MGRGVVAVAAVAFSLAGCGTEVGRIPFSGEGTGAATVTLKAGEVAFWTDIDIRYEGSTSLTYDVTLSQGGSVVARTKCDPLGRIPAKTSWTETNLGSSHTRHGNGEMTCAATLPHGGPTAVDATLAFAPKPSSVSLAKADLVLRQ